MENTTNFFSSQNIITVRPASLADIDLINGWYKSLFDYHTRFPAFNEYFHPIAEQDLEDEESAFFIGYINDVPVGYIACGIPIDDSIGEINRLWIEPEHRHMGVAKQLLAACSSKLKKLGCEYERVNVYSGNDACAVYLADNWKFSYACYEAFEKVVPYDVNTSQIVALSSEEADKYCAERNVWYDKNSTYFITNKSYMSVCSITGSSTDVCAVILGDVEDVPIFIDTLYSQYPNADKVTVTVPVEVNSLLDHGFKETELVMYKEF